MTCPHATARQLAFFPMEKNRRSGFPVKAAADLGPEEEACRSFRSPATTKVKEDARAWETFT